MVVSRPWQHCRKYRFHRFSESELQLTVINVAASAQAQFGLSFVDENGATACIGSIVDDDSPSNSELRASRVWIKTNTDTRCTASYRVDCKFFFLLGR